MCPCILYLSKPWNIWYMYFSLIFFLPCVYIQGACIRTWSDFRWDHTSIGKNVCSLFISQDINNIPHWHSVLETEREEKLPQFGGSRSKSMDVVFPCQHVKGFLRKAETMCLTCPKTYQSNPILYQSFCGILICNFIILVVVSQIAGAHISHA